jgi:heme exporter protein A
MIHIQGLVKSFGHTYALQGVDLEVAQGEFLTIVGPNGAGKTTLLRILATLLTPTSGLARINGLDLASRSAEIRRRIGFVSHQSLVYANLTPEENLRFYGRIYDVPALDERVEMLLNLVGLEARRHDPARTLSRGMQQRLAIARAIIHQPSVMLLDEPYTGLDQQATQMLRQLLQTVRTESRTVIMTTHNLERASELCDRLALLAKGRIVYQAENASLSLADLQQAYWLHVENRSTREEAEI